MLVCKISDEVKSKYPDLSFSGVSINGVEVTKQLQFITSIKKSIQNEFRSQFTVENIIEAPQVQAIRNLFDKLGIDKEANITALENLTRLFYRGGLPNINSVVDSCNTASLGTRMPVGVFDADTIKGVFKLELAEKDLSFEPIGMELQTVPAGSLILMDDVGVVGRPMYKDSSRTMVTLETKNIIVITVEYPPITEEDVEKILTLATQLIIQSSKGLIGEKFRFE